MEKSTQSLKNDNSEALDNATLESIKKQAAESSKLTDEQKAQIKAQAQSGATLTQEQKNQISAQAKAKAVLTETQKTQITAVAKQGAVLTDAQKAQIKTQAKEKAVLTDAQKTQIIANAQSAYPTTLTETEKALILTTAQNTATQTAVATALETAQSTATKTAVATALNVAQQIATQTAETTEYIETLEKSKEKLTFEIDPEINGAKKEEIIKIEREVESFINKEVRFKKISQKLQKLIVMLNTLYNVSIVHSKPNEKQKALQQLENAKNKTIEIAKEFKTSEEILKDPRLKERVIDLISYAEYLTLKISIRNSNQTPEETIKSLTIIRDFKNFDYINAFLAFVIEEISCGIRNKISILSNELLGKITQKERKLLEETFYEENFLHLLLKC